MKKLSISLFALAAISSAAIASQRNYDLRDSDTYFGKYATQLKNNDVRTNALAVESQPGILTNFKRLMKVSEENEQGGHSRQSDTKTTAPEEK